MLCASVTECVNECVCVWSRSGRFEELGRWDDEAGEICWSLIVKSLPKKFGI